MRQCLVLWIVICAVCMGGCGGGNAIWVTGVLQKDGQPYKPPEGRKLALYFYPTGASSNSSGDPEMADYDARDGTFKVPGPEGYGIPPGKYRIAVVETLRREARDELKKTSKLKHGEQRVTNDTNFLEATFGEKTSPFVRDLKASTNLSLDMAKPTE